MSFALLFSAFGYGLRHGFDWDHIAALTDISSVEKSKKRAFLLSSFYALGHAAVVMVLGVAIILADFTVPESVDTTLMYFIGFSLIALGVWVLTGIFFQGSNFRLKSRWMLIRDGLFKGVKRIRRTPRGRSISVEHHMGITMTVMLNYMNIPMILNHVMQCIIMCTSMSFSWIRNL